MNSWKSPFWNAAGRWGGFLCLYLVGHLVGPHGHLLHRHVCHVAVRVGGCPRGAELDFLWPAREGQRSDHQTDDIMRPGGFR